MIVVTTGTVSIPFVRLVDTMANYPNNQKRQIIIQTGIYNFTQTKTKVETKPFFSYRQMTKLYSQANAIVSAAGEGSIIHILQHSKTKPILFPRLKRYQEHVDNQQLEIGKELEKRNLVILATTKRALYKALDSSPEVNKKNGTFLKVNENLIQILSKIST